MKKPIYKRRWFIVLAVFIFMGMIGSFIEDDDTETAKTVEGTTEMTKAVESTTESTTTNEAPKEESAQPKVSSEAPKEEVAAVLSILQEGFGKVGTVRYDEDQNAYIITPTATDFKEALMQTFSSGVGTEAWNSLVGSLTDLSNTITKRVGTSASLAMENPFNTKNVILVIKDGVLVYDAVAEPFNQ